MQDTPEQKTLEVSVSGDGVSIKRTVDEGTAREIINILMGGAPGYTGGTPARPSGRRDTNRQEPSDERPVSLREYLDETQARRNPDKITAIGEYLSEHEGQGEFTRDDIKSRFKLAGEAAPANFGRDFAWAVSNGWIAEDHKNPGSFYVTKKGRDSIDARFAAEVTKGTRQKPSGRRRTPKRDSDNRNGRDDG